MTTSKKQTTYPTLTLDVTLNANGFIDFSKSIFKKDTVTITGVPSGYHELDITTKGFQPATLNVLAGSSKVGIDLLANNIAINSAKNGHSVLYITNASTSKLAMHFLSIESAIPFKNIAHGALSPDELLIINKTSKQLALLNIFIVDNECFTLENILVDSIRIKQQQHIDFIIIDNLEAICSIKSEGSHANINTSITLLKALAIALNVPVLLLSQMSGDFETYNNKRPEIEDLHSSSILKQCSELVLFLHRDEAYNPLTIDPTTAELNIAENRNGYKETIPLTFIRELMKFENKK